MPAFRGLKYSQDAETCRVFDDVENVGITKETHEMSDVRGTVGDGGNSGFQALNLVAQFEPRRIVLVGFDLSLERGIHWHGRHRSGLNNPSETNIRKWRDRLNASAGFFKAKGIEVYRESDVSTLIAFPVLTIERAFSRWASYRD